MGKQLIPLWAMAPYQHAPSTYARIGFWSDPTPSRYRRLSCADLQVIAGKNDVPE